MNKKEKNKSKPRIPGSRQLMKACHFYKSFPGLSGKHTPNSPAGRVCKDQLPGRPGSQAGIPHPHPMLLHNQPQAEQTQDYSPGHNGPSDQGRALQTFHSAFPGMEFHRPPLHHIRIMSFPHTPVLTSASQHMVPPCRGGRHKTEKVTAKHRQHYLTQMTSNCPGAGHSHTPQLRQQKPDFKKIQFGVTAQPSWSSLWLLLEDRIWGE